MKRRRRVRRRIALCSALILILCGIVWQAVMVHIEEKKYQPVGSFADVESYKAHYVSKGDGDTAFVFITGSGTPCAYTDFYKLQTMLSEVGQTITFDHAGSGWSECTEVPRTIENMTKELGILIDTAASGKPVVLICHSLGSLEAISYAQANMEKVKDIIFLDAGSPEFYVKDSEMLAKIMNRGSAAIRRIGLNRLLFEVGLPLPLYGENVRNHAIPSEVKEIDKIMYYRHTGNPESLKTIQLMNENARKVLEGGKLGELPILLLSSDNGREWNDVQIQLAAWSTNSEQITIPGSQHYIYWSNYEEVAEHIRSFIAR